MFFSKHKRYSNEKAAILKGIYHDNLRMAGIPIEDDRPISKWLAFSKPLQTLAVMLVVALFPFSELEPALDISEKAPLPALSSAYASIKKPLPLSFPATSGKIIETASNAYELPGVRSQAPDRRKNLGASVDPSNGQAANSNDLWNETAIWDFVAPGEPGLTDYNLLLEENDKVRLSSVFGLGVKTIVIDPGHGGRDPGAIGARGTREKDITLDVAMKLKKRLAEIGRYNVLLTRKNDRTLSLADRVQFAKDNKADLFISLHVNSLPNDTLNIIETYYFGAPLNSETLRLAEQENKESHFSVGELDSIIQDFGNRLKRQESAKLATAIQANLFKNIKHQDSQVRNFGIKMAPFVVLSQIEVPSVLVEISCITKVKEEVKLASSQYRSKVAAYMEEGIVAYLETQDFKSLRGEK